MCVDGCTHKYTRAHTHTQTQRERERAREQEREKEKDKDTDVDIYTNSCTYAHTYFLVIQIQEAERPDKLLQPKPRYLCYSLNPGILPQPEPGYFAAVATPYTLQLLPHRTPTAHNLNQLARFLLWQSKCQTAKLPNCQPANLPLYITAEEAFGYCVFDRALPYSSAWTKTEAREIGSKLHGKQGAWKARRIAL